MSRVEDKIFYQIQKYNTSKEAWDALKNLYGKVTKEDIYKIEDELVSLYPKTFDSIQHFIIRVKELRTNIDDCGSPNKDDNLIYLIHNKLPSEYSTFVSSYNTSKTTLGFAYQKVTFDRYAQLLEEEEHKLKSMGILQSSKSKALVANNEGSQNSACQTSNKGKGKKKKWKNNTQEDTKKATQPSNQQGKSSSNSNKKGDTNKEKKKCAYRKKLGHEEHKCYNKKIDELTIIMKKHNVPLPNSYKEK